MTLDITKPTDSDNVTEYAGYERETRVAVNANLASLSGVGAITSVSNITLNGQTTLSVGTELNSLPIEIIIITATGSETLNNILLAPEGQIKVLWVYSGSVNFVYNASNFSNNGDVDFAASTGDVIAYTNKNGDGVSVNGYWHELFRYVRV